MRKKKKIKISTVCLHLFFILAVFISVYPILLILFNAITSERYLTGIGYVLFPKEVTFEAFQYVLRDSTQLLQSLFASIVYSVIGGLFSVIVCALLGYTLTRNDFILKKPVTAIMLGSMFTHIGLIPSYMINTQVYHLDNTWLIYILPGSVTFMMAIIFRTFFQSVPYELTESAMIDGASHMQILFKILIPLSMPVLVTQFFLTMAARWKDYTTSMYYITEKSMITLEYYIQQIMQDASMLKANATQLGLDADIYPVESMRFAIVFFTLIPMLIIFPFMQKYFEKGAIVGSVKG